MANNPQDPASATDVKVYINNVELASNEFVWDAGNSPRNIKQVLLLRETLKVFVINDGDYTIDPNGNLLLDNVRSRTKNYCYTVQ